MAITAPKFIEIEDADDHLERERSLYASATTRLPTTTSRMSYEMALSAVKQAEERLMTKIPYKRPDDYFAEVYTHT